MSKTKRSLRAFDVFHPYEDEPFDTVFYNHDDLITYDEVKRSLVNHDGYPSDIIVVEQK